MKNALARWLREPLPWFVAIGVALFALGELRARRTVSGADRERIEVTAERVARLRADFESRWLRPPSEQELRTLIDEWVRREVLYRCALGLELDRDDDVVRRRLVQKLEFMTEDLASASAPTDAQLSAFLQQHLDDYRTPERRRFEQVYFNGDARGAGAERAAQELLAELRAPGAAPPDLAQLGDRLLLQPDGRPASEAEVGARFGPRFAAALFELEPGGWQGPIASAYGLHLARVTEVLPGAAPALDDVRDAVLRDWRAGERERAREQVFAGLAAGYEIAVDEDAVRAQSAPREAGP